MPNRRQTSKLQSEGSGFESQVWLFAPSESARFASPPVDGNLLWSTGNHIRYTYVVNLSLDFSLISNKFGDPTIGLSRGG